MPGLLLMPGRQPFRPHPLISNRHFQTILPTFYQHPDPVFETERLELDDGDFIDLLWGPHRSNKTLLVLHGLEGSVRSPYATRILNYCRQHEIAVVLMHFRGCGDQPNRLLRSYHSGETDDIRLVVSHLLGKGISDIALLGYSVGGNRILKYLGEDSPADQISSAVAVSVPYRLDICADVLNRGVARIYQSVLLKSLVAKMQAKKELLDATGHHFPDPTTMPNLREFDEHFTAAIYGFDGAQDYYTQSSSAGYVGNIIKPVTLIHAADDPFMTNTVIPQAKQLPASVQLELTRHGGHVGFIGRRQFNFYSWLEPRIHRHLIEAGFCED